MKFKTILSIKCHLLTDWYAECRGATLHAPFT